jgi:hypothetical protein
MLFIGHVGAKSILSPDKDVSKYPHLFVSVLLTKACPSPVGQSSILPEDYVPDIDIDMCV